MLAHIQNGTLIRTYNEGKGRVTLADGDTVSPPVAGYINGPDKIVPIVEETQDTSTGPDTVTERSETVEADRVFRLTTIRDMTQAEIDTRNAQRETRELSQSDRYGIIRALARATFEQENRLRTLEGRPTITAQQFRDWIKSQL